MKSVMLTLVLCCACRAANSPPDTGPGDTGPSTTTASFVPASFLVKEARFTLSEEGNLVSPSDGPMRMQVQLVTEASETCDAVWLSDVPQAVAAWSDPADTLLRWTRPDNAPVGTCTDADLPEGWQPVMGVLDAWDWGVGVTAAPTADVLALLSAQDRQDLGPFLLGGGFYIPGIDGDGDGVPDQEAWHANAIAWGENNDGQLLPTDTLLVNGVLQPATYVVRPQQALTPARALLNP